eukprot:Phypoly_transcript_03066.p1 GENE.Phypoly_transcript_03066~~Phypoly_transcript_03066.p1  ORF type:complete len:580 (-),score=103.49 Phypoly_transcript_03066:844-2463(-)
MGIKVYACQAKSNRHAKPFYQAIADVTNGSYLNFNNLDIVNEMIVAICYLEASSSMLTAYREELEKADKKKMECLRPIFDALCVPHKPHNDSAYLNLTPLVANSPWWNPKLHDHNKPPHFIQDTHTKKFVMQQDKKDKEVHELSRVYANTHLESNEMGINTSFENASSPILLITNSPANHNPKKKYKVDSVVDEGELHNRTGFDIHFDNVVPTPPFVTPQSHTSSSLSSSFSRRLINDDDNDEEEDHGSEGGGFAGARRRGNRGNRGNQFHHATTHDSIQLDTLMDDGFTNEVMVQVPTWDGMDDSPSPSELGIPTPDSRSNANLRYHTRLAKGRPRRSTSFAFGDVSPSTPFATLFATPSILTAQQQLHASSSSSLVTSIINDTASTSKKKTLSKKKKKKSFDASIADSGTCSDPETARKRKANWHTELLPHMERRTVIKSDLHGKIETPRIGQMVAVRAEFGGFWIARVVGFNGKEEVDVQWLDEIKSHLNFFVLLDWYDTISINAIFKSKVKIENMKKIGIYKLSDQEKQLLEDLW